MTHAVPDAGGGRRPTKERPGARRRGSKPRRRRGDARRVLAVAEEEVQRIVLDLHDGPVQDIFAALSQITFLRTRLRDASPESAALARATGLLESSLREIRGLLSTLRGPAFADRGLGEVLEEPAVEHEALTGTAVLLELKATPPVPLRVKVGLYRILQEALSNVRRHAEADVAKVRLWTHRGRIVLEIRDEGRGFDPPPLVGPEATERSEHIGLRGMRERAAMIGGSLRIRSHPGRGTRVRVEVPIHD
ncbi:MAG TPA: sensor histidine kinase [Vicinamibacteria bacterium]|nr:sensor histidine kinase [Vicinamibacteria bacterium]